MSPELNPRQKEAVEAPKKPLLIVAGAGTGKTRTLTSRLVHLIREGVPPARICALTFTNKAAREMSERVSATLREVTVGGGRPPFIGTFHSLGARILRTEGRHLGRTPKFVIYDDQDSTQLIRRILKNLEIGKDKGSGPAYYLDRVSRLKSGMLVWEEIEASRRPQDRWVRPVYEAYEAELEKNDAFDFDDLLEKVVRLFREKPQVREKYERMYQYLLVDEYQDLNNIQYDLIRLLAESSGQLSVVGDDQQTIYSWRGSNFEIFLNFERDWPESTVVVLDENYRSSGNIIAAASAVVAHNKKQKPKTLWTRHSAGEPVRLVETGNEEDEAWWIGETIAASGPKSTAILYRTNAQSRALEQALLERGIPYLVFGGLKFYERKEIRDLVACLRLVNNSRDSVSRERLEKSLGKTRLARLLEAIPGHEEDPPRTALAFVLDRTEYLALIDKNFVNAAERRENIGELVHFAGQFSDLSAMLEQVALLQATDTLAREADSETPPVHLMTMHMAKGLEFDRVFIAGCVEGLLPHAWSLETEAELEEERRLMYVAMTRAREELFISFYNLPSRFLSEIPPEFTRYESTFSDEPRRMDDEERYITLD